MTATIVKDLIEKAQSYQKKDEIELIKRAIEFSKNAHSKQFRNSGDPYYYHPIEVAKLLTESGVESS